jgi:ABC-type branched-subunit amino acid transport system substrate-binding protein
VAIHALIDLEADMVAPHGLFAEADRAEVERAHAALLEAVRGTRRAIGRARRDAKPHRRHAAPGRRASRRLLRRTIRMKITRFALTLTVVMGLLLASLPIAAQQAPIKIGEINSFSGIGAPFTGPYRSAVEMAVEEVNAKGGILGRKVEVLFRDDKGQPAEA